MKNTRPTNSIWKLIFTKVEGTILLTESYTYVLMQGYTNVPLNEKFSQKYIVYQTDDAL